MRVAVCVHAVPDPEARVRLIARSVDLVGVARHLDPSDAAAVEVALRLVERVDGEVVAYSVAPEQEEFALRSALAHGAASAVRVDRVATHGAEVAELLASAMAPEAFDLVLCGTSSADFGGGATPAALASALRLPLVQSVVAVDEIADGALVLQRSRDFGYREVVRLALPAVVAVSTSIAQPRFPTTQARLRAQRQSIAVVEPPPAQPSVPSASEYVVPPPSLGGIPWPDATLDARARLQFLLAGGQARTAGAGGRVEGSVDETVEAILRFIRERGLLRAHAADQRVQHADGDTAG